MAKLAGLKLNSSQFILYSIYLFIFILLTYEIGVFLVSSYQTIIYPFSLDYVEGLLLEYVYMIDKYGTYFLDINEEPYIFASYPPVFVYLYYWVLQFGGDPFVVGRSISFISSLGTSYFLYKTLVVLKINRPVAFLFAGIFLSPSFISTWYSLVRVDLLALFFTSVGVYIYAKNQNSERIYYSIPFFILAVFTKHSFLAAPLSIILFTSLRDFKFALRYATFFSIPSFFLFLLQQIHTSGEFYKHLYVHTKTVEFFWNLLPQKIYIFLSNTFSLLVVSVLGFYNQRNINYWLVYFLVCLLLLASIAKNGSNYNYYIETFYSLLLFSAFTLRDFDLRSNIFKLVVSFLLLAQLVLFLPINSKDFNFIVMNDSVAREKIDLYVKESEGLILSEDPGYLILNGKEIYISPFQFMQMSLKKEWDEKPILEACNNKTFSLVIASWRVENMPGLRDCLANNYSFVEILPNPVEGTLVSIYQPKKDNLGD